MTELQEGTNGMLKQKITNRIEHRLKSLFSSIATCLSHEYAYNSYYVAGNSCNAATPNDFDLYPKCDKFNFKDIKSKLQSVNGYVVCETRNAMTCNIGSKIVQFCNYSKPTLKCLVESFDFAHIQIGAKIAIERNPSNGDDVGGYDSSYSYVDEVYFTDEWLNSHALETTWFTGSEYPLSSLVRLQKYAERGCYSSKHESTADILKILNAIISRGYNDYDDYKDQLAAVYLLLLDPEESAAAEKLFKTCCAKKLVVDIDE